MLMFKFKATDAWYKWALELEKDCPEVEAGVPTPLPEEAPPADDDSGSTYKVPLTTIVNITPHTGADRLEMAWVYGFQVVVKKGQYKVGDKVVYVPVDSILPQWLEDK